MRTPLVAAAVLALLAPTPLATSYAAADPSTDGHIVWTKRIADGHEELLIANADGTGQRVLVPAAKGEVNFDAQFSPNGRWIAYEHDADDSFEVRLVRADGTHDHRLPVGCKDPCVGIGTPTWISNKRLFFVKVKGPFVDDTPAEVLQWSVDIDGSRQLRMSDARDAGKYEDSRAQVSPDGSFVTWTRLRYSDDKSTIMRVDVDGDDPAPILPWGLGVEVYDLSHATSGPTKGLVLFEAYGRGDPDATFVDLGTVPWLCNGVRQCRRKIDWLTNNKASGRRNANPHWSPDGSNYVFTDRENIDTEDVQVWTARYGTDERREISTSPRFDFRPDWGR
jgi:Tol biopolymer transport system component